MTANVAVFGLGKYQKSGILELRKKIFYIIGFDESKNPFSKKDVNKFFYVSFLDYKRIEKICKKIMLDICLHFQQMHLSN